MFLKEQIEIKANAKLNLTLDIVGRRSDGYHEIESLMQSVDLFDTVTIRHGNGTDDIEVSCTNEFLGGESNLAFKAAKLFFDAAGFKSGVRIDIIKRIPVSAGLGGGSADAAAVLLGLNALFETLFQTDRLCEIGLAVGADVPFCIRGGSMLAKGIGERLIPEQMLPECHIVIAKTGQKSSTGELYASYDRFGAKNRPDTKKMLEALQKGKLTDVCGSLCNVFEKLMPQSAGLKRKMLQFGALGSSLSGSGPSVFGIFPDEKSAYNCIKALGQEAFMCRPASCGCEITE